MGDYVNRLMAQLVAKNPGEPEFHQAVHEVADSVELALDRNPRYVEAKVFERTDRTRAGRDVPGAVGRRRRRGPGQPRLPRRDEQRDRPVQGRPSVPPDGLPGHAEVPRVRAGLQERAHHAADGRRQRRRRLRPEGQVRRRGDAVLPVVHDRAAAPHRASSPTCRPATSASAAGRSATCSASTSGSATSSPACSPARGSTGAAR